MATRITLVFALLAVCFFLATQCQYFGGGMMNPMYGRFPYGGLGGMGGFGGMGGYPYGGMGGYPYGGMGGYPYGGMGGVGYVGVQQGVQYPVGFYSNNQSETVDGADGANGENPEESK